MDKCRNCGADVPVGWTLCRSCLDRQKDERAYYSQLRPGGVLDLSAPLHTRLRRNFSTGKIAAILGAVAVILIVGMVLASGG